MFELIDGKYCAHCPKCAWKSESYPSVVFMDALDLWTLDLKIILSASIFSRITPDE